MSQSHLESAPSLTGRSELLDKSMASEADSFFGDEEEEDVKNNATPGMEATFDYESEPDVNNDTAQSSQDFSAAQGGLQTQKSSRSVASRLSTATGPEHYDEPPSPSLAQSPSARSAARSALRPTSARPPSSGTRQQANAGQSVTDEYEEEVSEDDGESNCDEDYEVNSIVQSQQSRRSGPVRQSSSVASSTYDEDDQFESPSASHAPTMRSRSTQRPSTAPNYSRRPMSAMRSSAPSPVPGMRTSMESRGGYGGRSAGGAYMSRPQSAAPVHQGAALGNLTRQHPSAWDARDVGTWVEYIGLGQYRKKFMHNQVDGRLLLRLTDKQLKYELGIGPLGHRTNLLDAITVLAESAESLGEADVPSSPMSSRMMARPMSARPMSSKQGEFPRRPATASPHVIPPDNFLGPASGKMTVYEQRSKLLFELDRAAHRASQQQALAQQLLHTANLSNEEVSKLRGLLRDMEAKNKHMITGNTTGFDSKARIPWHPVGHGTRHSNWNPERYARPGEDPRIDLTFQPRVSKSSKRMLVDQSGMQGDASGGSSFLTRLENDLRKRERTKQEAATAPLFTQDPMRAKRQQQRDFECLNDYLVAKGLTQEAQGLSKNPNEYEAEINDIFSQHADEWQLKETTLRGILGAKAEKKVAAASSAVRTMVFMQRYESELKEKDQRLKDLESKWWEQAMGNPKKAKEEEDISQMVRWFALLGWRGEGDEEITEDRLGALLKRARAYKEKCAKWKESVRELPVDQQGEPVVDIKWDSPPFSSDGIGSLMEQEMARASSRAEAGGAAAAGSGAEGMGKTKHANGIDIKVVPMGQGGDADYLLYTVKLLGVCRDDDLDMLDEQSGDAKKLAVYRVIRRQKFLEFTEAKMKEKERTKKALWDAMNAPKKTMNKQEQDIFFERLLEDEARRRSKAEKALAERRAKEAAALAAK